MNFLGFWLVTVRNSIATATALGCPTDHLFNGLKLPLDATTQTGKDRIRRSSVQIMRAPTTRTKIPESIFSFSLLGALNRQIPEIVGNVTTYRKDYKRRTCARREVFVPSMRDYDNSITGPYQEQVLPYRKYKPLLKPTNYPEPKEYTEQVCEKYPSARLYLKDPPWGPPDFDVIDRLYDDDNRTVYMVDYCRLGDFESKKKRDRTTRTLPKDWVVPLTTQRCGYRDPRSIIATSVPQVIRQRMKDSLSPNEKIREILGVKTGESDYMAIIGKTGEEIIEGKLHGDVNMRPQFSQDELLRAMLIRRE